MYENRFEDSLRNLLTCPKWDLIKYKEELESKLKLYQMLSDKGIDTDIRYYLTDNIYLSLSDLRPYFHMTGDSWIYNNYINSWSGINEWITDLIDSEYSLFSGNSPYCHAFNTMTIKEIFGVIENEKADNSKKVTLIENLVEFTKKNGKFKEIHNQVVKAVDFKLNMMKEGLGDE